MGGNDSGLVKSPLKGSQTPGPKQLAPHFRLSQERQMPGWAKCPDSAGARLRVQNARPSRLNRAGCTVLHLRRGPIRRQKVCADSHSHRFLPVAFGLAEARSASFSSSLLWCYCFAANRRAVPPKTMISRSRMNTRTMLAVLLVGLGVVVLACSGVSFMTPGKPVDLLGMHFETTETHFISQNALFKLCF